MLLNVASSLLRNGRAHVSNVERDAQRRREHKRHDGDDVGQAGFDVETHDSAHQNLDVGGRIVVPEPLANAPVPVGAWAVSPAVPCAKSEPGGRRQRDRPEMPPACRFPRPCDAVEHDPSRVEHEEGGVEDLVDGVPRVRTRCRSTRPRARAPVGWRAAYTDRKNGPERSYWLTPTRSCDRVSSSARTRPRTAAL